jgi:EAL and modified HD-GYP domain-containing signal transduction protein
MLNNKSHTVILDVTRYTPDDLRKRVDYLRGYKSLIAAAGVDTYDDLEYCKDLKFDFYQGHFLFRPAAQVQNIPVNRMNMLRLLSKLHDPKMEMADIEKLISQDVALTYRILQYANSAAMALRSKVNSAGHAVRLIGLDTIRSWSSALLLSSVDNKPRELMTSALIRARMCELLSESVTGADRESFLSAGLLSVLDALLDCPMEKALSELPLADDIKAALIDGSGPIGKALTCAIAYERADWNNVRFNGLAPAAVRSKYMTAIGWARKLTGELLN